MVNVVRMKDGELPASGELMWNVGIDDPRLQKLIEEDVPEGCKVNLWVRMSPKYLKEMLEIKLRNRRVPKVGEMRMCAICGGDCQPITEEQLKDWKGEIAPYDDELDRFLGYDGCEEPTGRFLDGR
jgi:hypothetical protein